MTSPPLSPIYQVYFDLGIIDPNSVQTEQQEKDYYNSLLYGCKNYNLVSENRLYMVTHYCSRNGKSQYELHQQQVLNHKIEKLSKNK